MPKKSNTKINKKRKPLKVGFDLDGVLLYNPARIIRPMVSFCKDIGFVKRKQLQFYCPETPREQWMWRMFHKSSIFKAAGISDIKKMVQDGEIEAYVVTARFKYLEDDFNDWMKKIGADEIFTKCYLNSKNEQPHEFKERMAKKLDLDIFVEDNWDIVKHLNTTWDSKKMKHGLDVFWIYNFFDSKIKYQYKYPQLKKAVDEIHSRLGKAR